MCNLEYIQIESNYLAKELIKDGFLNGKCPSEYSDDELEVMIKECVERYHTLLGNGLLY